MNKVKIMLTTIDDIRKFVEATSRCSCDIDLSSGRYVVDAKSIMGIFSLDLTKPVELSVPDDNCFKELSPIISPFIVQN